jgi:hypothetical protein
MEEHNSVNEHAIKMAGYTHHLEKLGCFILVDPQTDRVLQSPPPSYKGFVLKYNMS